MANDADAPPIRNASTTDPTTGVHLFETCIFLSPSSVSLIEYYMAPLMCPIAGTLFPSDPTILELKP